MLLLLLSLQLQIYDFKIDNNILLVSLMVKMFLRMNLLVYQSDISSIILVKVLNRRIETDTHGLNSIIRACTIYIIVFFVIVCVI